MVQWLRLLAPSAGGPGSIPGQGTGSRMSHLRILHAAAKRSNVLQLRPGAARKKEKEKKKKLLGNAKPFFTAVRACCIQLCVPRELVPVPSGCWGRVEMK